MRSPTHALTGARPHSIWGWTSRIWIRGGAARPVRGPRSSSSIFPPLRFTSMRFPGSMSLARSSGILLHPTSLPAGRIDDHAYRFVDWLAEAGQSWWQVLPLGPPDEFGSPYKARSAFAGSPQLLAASNATVTERDVERFRARNGFWIDDWVRFAGEPAVADQVLFDREWTELRSYAAERGIRLFGDMPLYVSEGSADFAAHPELFREGIVAGVPPDYFSADGQRWGNPLYDWRAM